MSRSPLPEATSKIDMLVAMSTFNDTVKDKNADDLNFPCFRISFPRDNLDPVSDDPYVPSLRGRGERTNSFGYVSSHVRLSSWNVQGLHNYHIAL